MKTVKEIKEMRNHWLEIGGWGLGIEYMFNIVIGIAEHLEATKTPGPDKLTLCSLKSAERQGALKALRWVRRCVDLNPQIEINTAITRLENGGDL